MKRTCPCGSPGKKQISAPEPMCDGCYSKLLGSMDLKTWRALHAPEEELTTQVIACLNAIPGVSVWRTKRKQGAKKSDDLDGVPDVTGYVSPEGWAIYVETKKAHPDSCSCSSCAGQRDFAARATAAGCVVILGVRKVRQAVDGVTEALSVKRAAAERRSA